MTETLKQSDYATLRKRLRNWSFTRGYTVSDVNWYCSFLAMILTSCHHSVKSPSLVLYSGLIAKLPIIVISV